MMATTHAFVGAALASATVFVAPSATPVAMLAGFCGGLVPDLDLLSSHRKDLHYPVLSWIPAGSALLFAAVLPTVTTLSLAAFLLAFAVHPVTDVFGGSCEPEPWKRTTDRAVFNHLRGEWHTARRWVRYDGAPEDLSLAAFSAAVVLTVGDRFVRDVALAGLAVSIGYTLVRKHLLDVVAALRDSLPSPIVTLLPERNQ